VISCSTFGAGFGSYGAGFSWRRVFMEPRFHGAAFSIKTGFSVKWLQNGSRVLITNPDKEIAEVGEEPIVQLSVIDKSYIF
jgi:hypothetical protein